MFCTYFCIMDLGKTIRVSNLNRQRPEIIRLSLYEYFYSHDTSAFLFLNCKELILLFQNIAQGHWGGGEDDR